MATRVESVEAAIAPPEDCPFPETLFALNMTSEARVTLPAELMAPPDASDPNATVFFSHVVFSIQSLPPTSTRIAPPPPSTPLPITLFRVNKQPLTWMVVSSPAKMAPPNDRWSASRTPFPSNLVELITALDPPPKSSAPPRVKNGFFELGAAVQVSNRAGFALIHSQAPWKRLRPENESPGTVCSDCGHSCGIPSVMLAMICD
jgi:hypothetical protein